MKRIRGRIERVRPLLEDERLKVKLRVAMEDGQLTEAYLPDRELSALLPRSVLVGDGSQAPALLLETVQPMLDRLAQGRMVRLWSYKERSYASFLSWRSVRFT